MNTKKTLAALFLGMAAVGYAQQNPPVLEEKKEENVVVAETPMPQPEAKPLFQSEALKNVDINLLLRSSYEVPEGGTNAFRLNESRLEIRGKVVENLEFRVRTRLNRVGADANLDRATNNLDHAYASYKFGAKKNWEILVGKQNNMIGSWEFDKNPVNEYQYSDVVGNYNNLFALGARFAYSPSENHTITLQALNPHNSQFSTLLPTTNYEINGNVASKTPYLAQLVWQGKFFNKTWNTWVSAGTSQYARNEDNIQVFVGNKVTLGGFEGYLDLGYSQFAFDHFNIANRTGNAYTVFQKNATPTITANNVIAEDINVKSAVLRLDYKFLNNWNVTAKGFYETVSAKDKALGNDFRKNLGYLIGLEFLPVAKQNFRLFAYYYGNDVRYNKNVPVTVKPVTSNVFAVGASYVINVL